MLNVGDTLQECVKVNAMSVNEYVTTIVVEDVGNRVQNVACIVALQMFHLIYSNIFSDGVLGFWENHGLQYSSLDL